jgi:hypothetical protein
MHVCLCVAVAGCTSYQDKVEARPARKLQQAPPIAAPESILGVIESRLPGDNSLLLAAIEQAGLTQVLNVSLAVVTVFVPPDSVS